MVVKAESPASELTSTPQANPTIKSASNALEAFYEADLKAAAREYRSLGCNVVLLRDKKPLHEWQKWVCERQAEQDFNGLPWAEANQYAVVCGTQLFNGLFLGAVDFDVKTLPEEAVERGLATLNKFLTTQRERTPSGGEHLIYYCRNKPKTVSAYHNEAALEILGEGKLCILAPSQGYRRLNDSLPSTVDDLETRFYEAMEKAGIKIDRQATVWFDREEVIGKPYRGRNPPCVEKLLTGASEGLRNEYSVRLSAYLANFRRLEPQKAWRQVSEWNKRNSPPLPEAELQTAFQSAAKNGYVYGCEDSILSSQCERADCALAKKQAERGDAGKYFDDETGRFVPKLLADEIMARHNFVTMKDNEELFVYLDGFYQPYGEVTVKGECRKELEGEFSRSRAAEVLEYVKVSNYTKRREEPANLLPLANGVLDLDSMELQRHSPDKLFFNKLPVKYDPRADCPNIKRFLREITAGEEDVEILLEAVGFCLYRDYFLAKALMLVGGGANGKSTFLNLVKAFLGFENISSRSLQDLEENRFAKANLQHKLANIYADLPDKALFRTGNFKMLTGRDPITAEHKFKAPFQFANYAKLLFSANKVPEAYDDTTAFFRRWIILVFPNEFNGEDADPYLLEALTTEQELSGLLNLTLKGLKKLRETGGFSYSKTTEEIKEDYIRKSSPIGSFVMDCLEANSDAYIVKKELYAAFTLYCRTRVLPMVTETTFFKNLPQYAAVTEYKPTIEGRQKHTFRGIRFSKKDSVSSVDRVNPTLVAEPEPDEDSTKMGKTVDTLSTLTISNKSLPEDGVSGGGQTGLQSPVKPEKPPDTTRIHHPYGSCFLCRKLLPSDLADTTVLEGRHVHLGCYLDWKQGQRRGADE